MATEKTAFSPLQRLSHGFDILSNEANVFKFERAIINFALVGFMLHLLIIFLVTHTSIGQPYFSHIQHNYLKAIYTPFSILLFYEVLTLILILPKSITSFIGKQYEIITLIAIRSFFHDIAEYDLDKSDIYTLSFLKEISIDLVGALLMFFLTSVFYQIFARTKKAKSEPSLKRTRFVDVKKATALVLTVLLLILSVISFWGWASQSYFAILSKQDLPDANIVFYKDFFSIMIFVDVFLLILSFIYNSAYDIIYRNAGFIISTILVRISLTAPKPYNICFALIAVLLGVLLIALSLYHNSKYVDKRQSV